MSLALVASGGAGAQDAVRGAQLYLRLPGDVPSCVSCHGPDPTQGRNNLLRAADNPAALLKALNDVGAMGFLKATLVSGDIEDLAGYLGRVAAMANPLGPVGVWPPTLEFGTLSSGTVSPEHRVRIENRSAAPARLGAPEVVAGPFTLVHDCPESLAPGGRCEARVRAAPGGLGTATGTLRWTSDAPWSPLVLGMAVATRAGGVGVLSAQSPDTGLTFPPTPVGESRTLAWTLVSTGAEPVTLANTSVSGPQAGEFTLAGDCTAGRVLAPAATCTLQITHRPAVALRSSATLQLRGSGTHPATLDLIGEGRAAAPDPPDTPVAPVDSAPGGGGGGCAAAPPASRPIDPALPVLLVLAGLGLARRPRR